MPAFLTFLGYYLVVGLLFILLMFLFNKRVWNNTKNAPYELFDKLVDKGTPAGLRTLQVITYLGLWTFWIFVIVGMFRRKIENSSNRKQSSSKTS